MADPRWIDELELARALPMEAAIEALEAALRDGLDPEEGPPREVVGVPAGQLLLMPAAAGRYAGVKIASVAPGNAARGLPRIQGVYLLLDGDTLTPVALLPGADLTSLRTPAVSGVAVRRITPDRPLSVVVFGAGPQAVRHIEAVAAVRTISRIVAVLGRPGHPDRPDGPERRDRPDGSERPGSGGPERPGGSVGGGGGGGDASAQTAAGREARLATMEAVAPPGVPVEAGDASAVADADLVVCCTSATEPIFPGHLLRDDAAVVAMGSHEPHAREVDDEAVARAALYVEARSAALREAGDLILAGVTADRLINLAELMTAPVDLTRPRLFKSVGMPWEDLVTAAAAHDRART
ncbi:MAG: ornithine cyclodeaminase family protein [Streptosporangiales bacterium]|nr:ornithine cyclodeaminase family protein [Streptosporangiales bacterium]